MLYLFTPIHSFTTLLLLHHAHAWWLKKEDRSKTSKRHKPFIKNLQNNIEKSVLVPFLSIHWFLFKVNSVILLISYLLLTHFLCLFRFPRDGISLAFIRFPFQFWMVIIFIWINYQQIEGSMDMPTPSWKVNLNMNIQNSALLIKTDNFFF